MLKLGAEVRRSDPRPGSVVGMLAAENPSVDGHLAASTPLKGGNVVSVS